MSTKPWYHTTTIYQIYPRSFYDSNGDGIGDIQGIIQKLDYLKGLGLETIWCSPFFGSPQQDFGYDISNYTGIAPEYGSMDDARQLIEAVHTAWDEDRVRYGHEPYLHRASLVQRIAPLAR